jgi:hypothetical protein
MNKIALKEVAELAERLSQDESDETNGLIAGCLFALCGAIAAGTEFVIVFSVLCSDFASTLIHSIEYSEWIDKA